MPRMTDHPPSPEPRAAGIAGWPCHLQWAALLALSTVLVVPLELSGFPAALLLGPMIAAIVLGVSDARVRVAQPLFMLAQGVIGLMMARALPSEIFVELAKDWPIYTLGTTAIWGSAPGAASTIVLMADAFGADARLVAFMTYLRVVLVALAASLVARFAVPEGMAPPPMNVPCSPPTAR